MRDASCWEAPHEYTIAGMAAVVEQIQRRTSSMSTLQIDYYDPDSAARGRAAAAKVTKARHARNRAKRING